MSDEPSIFIGSSSEALDYANALQRVLDHDFEATVWSYGVFLPGGNTLASLVDRARRTDFAALFLTPDDEALVRDAYLKTPRDNLVFELGLFIGQIGPERAFLLRPREQVVDLPSDLQGVTPLTYRTDRADNDLLNAVNPAATDIKNAAKRLGRRARSETPDSPRVQAPSSEVLKALGQLGGLAESKGASLEINPAGAHHQIVVLDRTRLGESVVVDLSDRSAVQAIETLSSNLLAR